MATPVKPPAEREAVALNPEADKPTFEGTDPATSGKRKKERLVWETRVTLKDSGDTVAWEEVKGQPSPGHGQTSSAESWLRRNVSDGLLPDGGTYRLVRVVPAGPNGQETVHPRLVHKVAVAL